MQRLITYLYNIFEFCCQLEVKILVPAEIFELQELQQILAAEPN